ncbi:MAG: MFS transporter [Candidatus Methanomethylophilus sp.]|nr:MFS transporter [Methanomethylophilus sp.]
MTHMTPDEFRRAAAMWGIAVCLLASAMGWVFMRFGQAWSVADLPVSDYVSQIVPAYVVSEVAMIPVGGKLIDRYGCRAILSVAPFIFVVSSMLCIISPTVELLVLFRLVEGAGAGLILALAFSCVGKFYDGAARGRCNGLMTAAFAIGSLFGSATGYFLTETFNWRSGFLLLSLLMLAGYIPAWRFLPEEKESETPLDVAGLLVTAAAFGVATLYSQMINVNFDLFSLESLGMAVLTAVLTFALMHHAYRSGNPVIPVHTGVFERRMLVLMFMFSLCGLGLIQYFFKLYLTYYDFDIYGATRMFIVMIAGAALTSLPGSRLVYRIGGRPLIVAGSVIVTVALALTHFIADDGIPMLALSLFVFGIGLGCIVTEIICCMQSIVPKDDMGQHTGNLMAVRMVGILAGNAFIGAYINDAIRGDGTPMLIDFTSTSDVVAAIEEHVSAALNYLAESMDSGFLTTALILAAVTTILIPVAFRLTYADLEGLRNPSSTDNP